MKNNIINCRFCKTKLIHKVVDLGMSPLANSYVSKNSNRKKEVLYPLCVYVCSKCFLVQIPEHEKAENIFSNEYAYYSSYSKSWLEHAHDYVEMMMKKYKFNKKNFIIEIASNDGYLLQYFRKYKIPLLGIEPTKNTAEIAKSKRIPTLVKFFTKKLAIELSKKNKRADLMIGNNVLAHVPNLNDFIEGIAVCLKEDGIATFEFPHLLQLMKKNEFDTIYHEHFSYFSLLALQRIFNFHDLTIFNVEEIPTHGGSLRLYIKRKESKKNPETVNVNMLLKKEKKFGLAKLSTYKNFQQKTLHIKKDLVKTLTNLKKNGKHIVGYGAPAKGNTLLNYCGISQDTIDYTVDKNPHKQGKMLPGVKIPIFSPRRIMMTKPEYILILPWNLKEEIINQLYYVTSWGCKFIVAIPEVMISG